MKHLYLHSEVLLGCLISQAFVWPACSQDLNTTTSQSPYNGTVQSNLTNAKSLLPTKGDGAGGSNVTENKLALPVGRAIIISYEKPNKIDQYGRQIEKPVSGTNLPVRSSGTSAGESSSAAPPDYSAAPDYDSSSAAPPDYSEAPDYDSSSAAPPDYSEATDYESSSAAPPDYSEAPDYESSSAASTSG